MTNPVQKFLANWKIRRSPAMAQLRSDDRMRARRHAEMRRIIRAEQPTRRTRAVRAIRPSQRRAGR